MTAPPLAAETAKPMAVRLVDHLGRALAGRGLSRRRFLSRVAVVGSALAIGPIRYTLRPGTAYASVCGDGASCASGWTAFCCTVNNGANTCPPGSYVAGWWRIDDSPFCFGRARYVIDCNRSPNASCSCRCATGTCDQRRVCCNNFRYGQCNTQIPGVTEVVCRVVTCMAPWQWDPACSTTVRVDNRTRSHNAPCLPGRNATPIDIRYQDLGQTGSILGAPTTPERDGPAGGRYRRYENGSIHWRSSTGALAVHGRLDAEHRDLRGAEGPLGYPTTEVRAVGDGQGLVVRYTGGSIYQASSGSRARAVLGPFDDRYRGTGGPRGRFGYPTGRRTLGSGAIQLFEGSNLARADGGPVVEVVPDVLQAVDAASGEDVVGAPLLEERSVAGTRLQRFEHGVVIQTTGGGLVAIGRDLAFRYLDVEGGPARWGRPRGAPTSIAGGRGRELRLADATIYAGASTGTWLLHGPVLTAYREAGGPGGSLGLPTSGVATTTLGQTRGSFELGAIVIEPDGTVSVLHHRGTRRPSELARTLPDPGGASRRTPRRPSDLAP
jgi:uncharacterized protein with LGFP repeats